MDTEKIIKEHVPSLYNLISQTGCNFSWISVNNSLSKHLQKAKEKLSKDGAFFKDVNLFSLLIEKMFGEGKGDSMLGFYIQLFISLDQTLELNEKKLIHSTLKNILTNNDKDYLNFIGELATLNAILKTNKYNLKSVEHKIIESEEKTADFLFVQKNDGAEIYLEVLNIHLYKKDFQDFSEIEYHLRSKFEIKKKEKILTSDKTILIQPIFWTKSEKQLEQLSSFYNNSNFEVESIQTPLAYASWIIDGNVEHRFENIKTITVN